MEISWPELPKVPSTFSEVADLAGSAAGSAFSAVGTLVGKASEAFNEFSEVGGYEFSLRPNPLNPKFLDPSKIYDLRVVYNIM